MRLSASEPAADAEPKTPVGAESVESVVRGQLAKALGGKRGMLEAAVPTLAFTILFVTTKDLRLSIGVSVATAVVPPATCGLSTLERRRSIPRLAPR